MTLDELMAKFPHGSRWFRHPAEVLTVIGWQEPYDVVWRNRHSQIFTTPARTMLTFKREAPCPITEPLTVYQRSDALWQGWEPAFRGPLPAITLHPDGRYTWEGGPE